MRSLKSLLFVVPVFLVCSSAALACVCVYEPGKLNNKEIKAAIVREFKESAMVFSGEVIAQDRFKVKFKTISVWKGDAFVEITMSTGVKKIGEDMFRYSSCDYGFRLGEKYLVYARTDDDYELVVRACTRTRPLANGQLDIPELDLLNPDAYHAPPPELIGSEVLLEFRVQALACLARRSKNAA